LSIERLSGPSSIRLTKTHVDLNHALRPFVGARDFGDQGNIAVNLKSTVEYIKLLFSQFIDQCLNTRSRVTSSD